MQLTRPDRVFPGHRGRLIAERVTAAANVHRLIFEVRDGGATAYVRTVYRSGGSNR